MKKIILALSAGAIALSSSSAFAYYGFQNRNASDDAIYAQAAPVAKIATHHMKVQHVRKQTPADKRTSNAQNPKL
jgi:hypothetical protein